MKYIALPQTWHGSASRNYKWGPIDNPLSVFGPW